MINFLRGFESVSANFVRYVYGTAEKFKNHPKDNHTIYFITDTETGSHRIYLGDACYNIDVVTRLDNNISDINVPSTSAVQEELNKKSNLCQVSSFNIETISDTLVLENDHEYRYTYLSECSNVTVRIQPHETKRFYSSLVLSKINSDKSIKEFITVTESPDYPVMFLNGDSPLSGMNTLELLFFDNGLNICCIGAAYNYELPAT